MPDPNYSVPNQSIHYHPTKTLTNKGLAACLLSNYSFNVLITFRVTYPYEPTAYAFRAFGKKSFFIEESRNVHFPFRRY